MRRRILSFALSLAMCLALLPSTASAAGTEVAVTEVVSPRYDAVKDFSEGMAAVAVRNNQGHLRWGFIDKTGKEVIPCKYDLSSGGLYMSTVGFSEGLAHVCVVDYEAIDRQLRTVWATTLGKHGFIDKAGTEVIPLQYDIAGDFSEGLAMVGIKNGNLKNDEFTTYYELDCGYIDKTGKAVIPLQYREGKAFSEGLAAVQDENGKWGFIDKTGKVVIPFQYRDTEDFSDGMAAVKDKNGKWGFIDKTGKVVIPFQYKDTEDFSDGMAAVMVEIGNWIYIDKTGKEIIPTDDGSKSYSFSEYSSIGGRSLSDGMVAVGDGIGEGLLWGFVSVCRTVWPDLSDTSTTVGGFSDVKTNDYFAKPVVWAVENGITNGTGATTFSPDETCTQGQILTFLWRAKGEPAPVRTVSGSQFYAKAALWAEEQGLTDDFSAEANCTRAMVVTYLWKLASSPEANTSVFSDVSANADYAQAVAWAVEQGITNGTSSTTFSPDKICTRGQIATFLYRGLAASDEDTITEIDIQALPKPPEDILLIRSGYVNGDSKSGYTFNLDSNGMTTPASILPDDYKIISYAADSNAFWYMKTASTGMYDDIYGPSKAQTLSSALAASRVSSYGDAYVILPNSYMLFFRPDAKSLDDVVFACRAEDILNYVDDPFKGMVPYTGQGNATSISVELVDYTDPPSNELGKGTYRFAFDLAGYEKFGYLHDEYAEHLTVDSIGIGLYYDATLTFEPGLKSGEGEFEIDLFPETREYEVSLYTDVGNKYTTTFMVDFVSPYVPEEKPIIVKPPKVTFIGLPADDETNRSEPLYLTVETDIPAMLQWDGAVVNWQQHNTSNEIVITENGSYRYVVYSEMGQTTIGQLEINCFG